MAALATYHVRGMTDVAGSPGVEIDTVKVEVFGDHSVRFTRANGDVVQVRDIEAFKMFADIFNTNLGIVPQSA